MATDHELIELNRKYYSNSYLYRSNPDAILDAERAIDLESDVPDNFDLMGNILTAMHMPLQCNTPAF